MSYSPEQIEECADGYDALGEPVGASMLRAYAATLRQQAARVDEATVREVISDLREWGQAGDEQLLVRANWLEAALSAQPGEAPCPHEAWEENGGWCRCSDCGKGWRATAQPAERQGEAVTDKQVAAAIKTSPELDALIDTEPKASIAFAAYRLGRTHAAPVGVPEVIEEIAKQWDGCMYDAPGETLDIGKCIRAAGKSLAAAPSAPQGNAGLGIPSCGKPLCSENDHHPLCPSAPQGEGSARERLEDERWRLMNSFGNGPVADGQTRDRIAEIDAQLATNQPMERK